MSDYCKPEDADELDRRFTGDLRPKAVSSNALLAAWQSHCGNSDSMYPCENFKAGWKAGRMDMEGITEQDIAKTMPPRFHG